MTGSLINQELVAVLYENLIGSYTKRYSYEYCRGSSPVGNDWLQLSGVYRMKRMGIFQTGLLILLFLAIPMIPALAQPITPPVVITSPGVYEISADARGIIDVYGIQVECSDVIIDGQGHFLGGDNRDKSVGVYVNKYGDAITNITVKNLKLENWNTAIEYTYVKGNEGDTNQITNCDIVKSNTGIHIEYSDYILADSNLIRETSKGIIVEGLSTHVSLNESTIKDCGTGLIITNTEDITIQGNNINTCQVYGIDVTDSTGIVITKNSVSDNKYAALKVEKSTDVSVIANNFSKTEIGAVFVVGNDVRDSLVVDNYFGSVTNLVVDDVSSGIVWNSTLQPGVNILGGPYLGGNYWGSAPGLTGFSDTVPDEDGYGIGDEPYVINDYNTDYLPLHPTAEKYPALEGIEIIPSLPVPESDEMQSQLSAEQNLTDESVNETEILEDDAGVTGENNGSVSEAMPLELINETVADNQTFIQNGTNNFSILNESVTNAYAVDEVDLPLSITTVNEPKVLESPLNSTPVEQMQAGTGYFLFSPLLIGSSVSLTTASGLTVALDPVNEQNLTIPVPSTPKIYVAWSITKEGYQPSSGVFDTYPKTGETVIIQVWQQLLPDLKDSVIIPEFNNTSLKTESASTTMETPTPVLTPDIPYLPETENKSDLLNGPVVVTNAAGGNPVNGFIISSSAGAGGSIFPEGSLTVTQGESVGFVITPNDGRNISYLVVDGKTLDPVSGYRFTNVTQDHIIVAGFT